MRTFYLLQAIHNWFWLLFIYIYFEETTIQRNMAINYIQSGLFSKYKRYEHFGYCPVCNVFEQQWIASYLRLSYWLCLIIFKFIWQNHVPVNEIYMFSISHLKVVTAT